MAKRGNGWVHSHRRRPCAGGKEQSSSVHCEKCAEGRELFCPPAKLKLGIGNSSRTRCDLFTAGRFTVELSMHRIKQLARIYAKSAAPVKIVREKGAIRIDSTVIKTGE